ncbi:uncharacterized protein BDZ99DRAFT_465553 [Mytilinidion resinicola]|uniref:Uncharacterized protein n=1 Tax=Mytilinidion resinicola TaxID=574789 RepID=A0A6A6YDF8_9PEZI|nr:uncharacterized protein BDZ99DRAFT_465553 [Mytilinidion resinicola]KAF2806760.1 hypothetical protein BDZ99DRAFT_465553 [Mytilinidion resinicola]
MEPKKEQPDKGKARATADQKDEEPTSLTSRIASSASGLARNLIGAPRGNELQGQLASASGISSKLANGSSSSASQSVWSEGFPSRPPQQFSNSSSENAYAYNNGESFRSTSNQTNDQEFNDFLNSSNLNNPDGHASQQHTNLRAVDFQNQAGLNHYSWDRLAKPADALERDRSQGQTFDDGAEVRMLLADPSFQPAWEEAEVMTAAPVEDPAMDLFWENFSPNEQRAADRIRSALPAPPVHGQVSSQNPLNLRPDFESLISHMQSELDSEEVSNIEGMNTPRRRQLASEWDGVLNGYTDEVWGNMLPAVKEARSQLEEVKAGSERLDSTTITRLKMILGHVVQSADPSLLNLRAPSTAGSSQAQGQRSGAMSGIAQLGTSTNQAAYVNEAQRDDYRVSHVANAQRFDSLTHSERTLVQNQANGHQLRRQQARQGSAMEEVGEDHFREVAFHCPWISCHEASTLSQNSSSWLTLLYSVSITFSNFVFIPALTPSTLVHIKVAL